VKEEFLKYLKFNRNYSAHTIRAYKTDLEPFIEFLGGEEGLRAAKIAHVRSYLMHLRGEALDRRTICRMLSTLRSFFEFLVSQGRLKLNPFRLIRSPKAARELPRCLEEKQANQLVELPKGDKMGEARDRAMLELLYGCGLRCSELTGLDLRSFDLGSKTIRVMGKGSKQRILPLGDAAIQAIKAYLPLRSAKAKGDALFINKNGTRLSNVTVRSRLRKLCEELGILQKVTPHTLRHSFATHMLGNGADIRSVQELLGHAQPTTTQIYTHVLPGKLKSIYDRAHPRAK
jgi:tyrosine recombinase XerC